MARKESVSSGTKPIKNAMKWFMKFLLAQLGGFQEQEYQRPNQDSRTVLKNISNKEKTSATKNSSKNKNHKGSEKTDLWGSSLTTDPKDKIKKVRVAETKMSFNNSTLPCMNPVHNERYWVSFDEKSFRKGRTFKVYKGKINGSGPSCGDKCVLKVFREDEEETENLCRTEVKKSQKAREMGRLFNEMSRQTGTRIKFTTLYMALIDELSFIKSVFFSGRRKLTTGETVLFERDLRVSDDGFGERREMTMFLDHAGRKKHCLARDLEAFAHLTYHRSNGELVLCNLEGVQDDRGFCLKTPCIHSLSQEYGNSDQGVQGIHEFFKHHVCNNMCKDMKKPLESLSDSAVDGRSNSMSQGRSSSVTTTTSSVYQGQHRRFSDVFNNNDASRVTRSDSVFSDRSVTDNRPITEGQESRSPSFSMSDSLPPTAPPYEEIDCEVSSPDPPPYSSNTVANWILHELARNMFINCPPNHPFLLQARNEVLLNQRNSDNAAAQNDASHSFLNNNFNTVATPSGSTSGYRDDCGMSDRTVTGHIS